MTTVVDHVVIGTGTTSREMAYEPVRQQVTTAKDSRGKTLIYQYELQAPFNLETAVSSSHSRAKII